MVEDMTQFFVDHGVMAEWTPSAGGAVVEAMVMFDSPDDLVLGNSVIVQNTSTLTYATGLFPGLDEDEVLLIGGQSWRVQETPKAIEDGRLTVALVIGG